VSRIRTIKPEFWTAGQVLECSRNARLLFIALWNFCDDHGRHPYRPKQIKAEAFPADDDISSEIILGMLQELERNGLICRYAVEDAEYFVVTGWHHQRIDKRQDAKYPPPPQTHSANDPRTLPPDRKGREGIGKEKKERGAGAPNDFAFEGEVVRLSKPDFDQWVKSYSHLDLRAELASRDAWLASDRATAPDRKNWFVSTAAHLANRNRAARAAAAPPDPGNAFQKVAI